MSGKGDTPRPFAVDAETFASNWEAVFGNKQMGHSSIGRAAGSNPAATSSCVGSTPTAPAIIHQDGDYALYCDGTQHFKAKPGSIERMKGQPCNCKPIYIDPVSGAQVDEHWWPGDPVGYQER